MIVCPWSTSVMQGVGMPWALLCGLTVGLELVVGVCDSGGVTVTVGSADGSGVGTMNVSVAVGETVTVAVDRSAEGDTVTVGPGTSMVTVGVGTLDGDPPGGPSAVGFVVSA
jgi:hypothetical protein